VTSGRDRATRMRPIQRKVRSGVLLVHRWNNWQRLQLLRALPAGRALHYSPVG